MEAKRIPENIDYQAINGLATEAKQKLQKSNQKRLPKSRIRCEPRWFEAVASSRMIDCEEATAFCFELVYSFSKLQKRLS